MSAEKDPREPLPTHASDAVDPGAKRARRPYVAPEVRRLGSVRELTLALSGSPIEGFTGGMMTM